MPDISTTEPASFVAGDTLTWRRQFADYPASAGWVLAYTLINAATKITVGSSASGDDHLVNVAAATTAGYAAGKYDWIATVTRTTERHTVGGGRIEIKPNLAAATTLDNRTPMRKALEALEAAYVDYLSGGKGHVAEYDINGRRMKFRSAAEIWQQIEKLRSEVAAECRAARLAAGLPARRRVLVRFGG